MTATDTILKITLRTRVVQFAAGLFMGWPQYAAGHAPPRATGKDTSEVVGHSEATVLRLANNGSFEVWLDLSTDHLAVAPELAESGTWHLKRRRTILTLKGNDGTKTSLKALSYGEDTYLFEPLAKADICNAINQHSTEISSIFAYRLTEGDANALKMALENPSTWSCIANSPGGLEVVGKGLELVSLEEHDFPPEERTADLTERLSRPVGWSVLLERNEHDAVFTGMELYWCADIGHETKLVVTMMQDHHVRARSTGIWNEDLTTLPKIGDQLSVTRCGE